MKLSSYVRVWLEGGKGPRIKETSDYVKFLESEIERSISLEAKEHSGDTMEAIEYLTKALGSDCYSIVTSLLEAEIINERLAHKLSGQIFNE